jgi:hypothetical protein
MSSIYDVVDACWLCGQVHGSYQKQLPYNYHRTLTCIVMPQIHIVTMTITSWHHGIEWLEFFLKMQLVVNYVVNYDTISYAIKFSIYKDYCFTIAKL